jgi:hypothetical protein
MTSSGAGYGYGIVRRESSERTLLGHGGGMVGYFAHLLTDLDAGLGVAVLINGPGAPGAIATHALALLCAATLGQPLPPPERAIAPPDPDAFVGSYLRREGPGFDEVEVALPTPDDDRLALRFAGELVGLDLYGDDAFLVDHPAWIPFRLAVERDETGRIAGFAHGGAWYERAGATVERAPFPPASWRAFVGHYRSHNPWCPAFRVVLRRGRLWLIFPTAPDGFADEQPLSPLDAPGAFRSGDDPAGPETVTFDALVDNRALRATLSGCPYWRVDAS